MFTSQSFGSHSTTLGLGTSQAGSFLASPQSKNGMRQDDRQTCLPVTVRMLMKTYVQKNDAGGELTVHDTEPTHVALVGFVEKLNQQVASLEFMMNDSTGRLPIRYFTSGGRFDKREAIEDGQYVSIVGNVRSSPTLHVSAMNVRVVESPDLISYHMIESAYACLKLQHKRIDAPLAGATTPIGHIQASVVRTIEAPPPVSFAASPAHVMTPHPFSSPPKEFASSSALLSTTAALPSHNADLRDTVLQILQKEAETYGEGGVPFEVICKHVGSGVAVESVKVELETFVEEGEAYNTIDENHYAPT